MSTTTDFPQSDSPQSQTLAPQSPVLSRSDLVTEFQANRSRLLRLIELRLDRRLAGRVDPSDIFQDTFLRASAAFDDYCRLSTMPIYNWLRVQAQFAVGDCHRTHLGTLKRTVGMEQRAASESLALAFEELAESMISPGSQVANADLAATVRTMIAEMPEGDREILMLRHVEQMTVSEAAAELNISVEAAKKRHLRAIRRLQVLCEGLNGSGIR